MKCLIGLMGCLAISLALGCDAGDVDMERVPPGGEAPMGQSDPAARTHADPLPAESTSPDQNQ